jgi:pimeloyl-ACP methyl ester carboxylesterase
MSSSSCPKTKIRYLITLTLLFIARGTFAQSESYPPPGEIYTVNSKAMHMICEGEGEPIVILEAGIGGFSLNWSWVQPEIAKFTRVCSYDRSGYGWSEPTDQDFSIDAASADLHNLLKTAQIEPPYIMVGHSFGSVIIRDYHDKYPEQVLGMVFVDAVHPQLSVRMPYYPDALKNQMDGLRLFSGFARLAAVQSEDSVLPVPTDVPETVADMYIAKLLEPNFFEASYTEAMCLIDCLPELTLSDDLGDMPLVVLRHGIPESISFLGAPLSPELADQAEITWQTLQVELTNLSSNGKLIVAEDSRHNIQFDQPELVVNAVHEMLLSLEE